MNNSIFPNIVSEVSGNTETEMNNNEEIILKEENEMFLIDKSIYENGVETGYRLQITDRKLKMYYPGKTQTLTF